MKELLFSVTANDCEWSYTKGTGCGGQKRNKTSSAVHCMHRPSGAHGYSEASRSQLDNKRDAFVKMCETKKFKAWHRMEFMRRTGEAAALEAKMQDSLRHIRIDTRVNGLWVETAESALTD
ncbi:MAG: peptide chain release factor-like protein [Pseudomonadota bacterium]|nr:peptide chain release factor-like protein [Pseudomonadota bacterium]